MSRLQPSLLSRGAAIVIVITVMLLLAWSAGAMGAEPTFAPVPAVSSGPIATSGPLLLTGDIRSDGGGPGLVGSPLLIMLGVVLLGTAAAAATAVISRFAKRP